MTDTNAQVCAAVAQPLQKNDPSAPDVRLLQEQAAAWFLVADTLTEVAEWWHDLDGSGMEKAAKAIRRLAAQPQGKPLQGCIDDLIGKHGSLRAVARECALDVGYLSCLHRGEKDNPSEATLEALGLCRHGAIYSPA